MEPDKSGGVFIGPVASPRSLPPKQSYERASLYRVFCTTLYLTCRGACNGVVSRQIMVAGSGRRKDSPFLNVTDLGQSVKRIGVPAFLGVFSTGTFDLVSADRLRRCVL